MESGSLLSTVKIPDQHRKKEDGAVSSLWIYESSGSLNWLSTEVIETSLQKFELIDFIEVKKYNKIL